VRLTLEEAISKYTEEPPKGEFVLILEGASESEMKQEERKKWENMGIEEHVKMYMEQGMSKKEAMKKAAEDRGISKREVYSSLL